MTKFDPPYPSGLPVGDGWLEQAATAPVTFPYDGTVVCDAPVGDVSVAHRALDEAVAVAGEVAAAAAHRRRSALEGVERRLAAHRDEFEQLLVLESGKPIVDCRTEVARTLVTWSAAAEEVGRIHGETVPLDATPSGEGLLGFWVRKPVGVVVGIAGFNYPLLLASHKIAPAIAAGCPVVIKPAPQTPLATLWLAHLAREALAEAGLPPSAVQTVTGDAAVGSALVTDRRIGAVSFTGSAAVGHRIARDAAPTKTLLELGSNAALVVAADADLDAAVDAIVRGGYYASGQACIAVQRVIVEESVRDAVIRRLEKRMPEVRVGDPRDPETRVSALIDDRSADRVEAWVGAAVDAGAHLLAGGTREGRAVAPTLLDDVPDGLDAWDEEVFGPVVALRSVPDIEAAFDAVNRSRYGLHASVFTTSLDTALSALQRLEVGGVIVNEVPGFRSDTMPYGGVKDSGIGREGPRFAIEEMTVTRMAVIRLPRAA